MQTTHTIEERRALVRAWTRHVPTCDQAHPGVCPCCGAAGRPVGRPLAIVGHGVVERQVLGPPTACGVATIRLVTVRRHRCRRCRAVLPVGPRGPLPRRRYSAGAIGAALARIASGQTAVAVRSVEMPPAIRGILTAK